MTWSDLLAYLWNHGCPYVRGGHCHTVVRNTANSKQTEVPFHRIIKFATVRRIFKDLGIPLPAKRWLVSR